MARLDAATLQRVGTTPLFRVVPDTTLEWAKWASEHGWHVFPVDSPALGECASWHGGKADQCSQRGKHPVGKWKTQASTDERVIEAWFQDARNVGVHCGKSGLLVLDEDQEGALTRLAEELGHTIPETFRVSTRLGRQHFYFNQPDGLTFTNRPGLFAKHGIDVRGDGGYVVGPGSWHATGVQYQPVDLDAEVADLPEWVAALLVGPEPSPAKAERPTEDRTRPTSAALPTPPTEITERAVAWAKSAVEQEIALLRTAREGDRNGALNVASLKVHKKVAGGLIDPGEAFRVLRDAALDIGLTEPEISDTIQSGKSKGMTQPEFGPPADPQEEPNPDAWEGFDLTGLLENEADPIERIGKGGLIYRGSVTWLYGDPGSGKSVLTYGWAIDIMKAGGKALLLDEETTERDVAAKMKALGLTTKMAKKQFRYLRPSGRDVLKEYKRLREMVEEFQPTIVILDSAAAHLAISGKKENDNGEVTEFISKALLPIARSAGQPAVVVIDHMVKDKTSGGSNSARGAFSKRGASDVSYMVEVKKPFSKKQSGDLKIICHKDRFGDIGPMTEFQVQVLVTDEGKEIDLVITELSPEEIAQIREQRAVEGGGAVARRKKAILDALDGAELLDGERAPMLRAEIQMAIGESSENRVREALSELAKDGLIRAVKGKANANAYRLA